MTAHAQDIATVQRLLPVRIDELRSENGSITIVDRDGRTFCKVPFDTLAAGTDRSRAVMIVSAVNQLQDQLGQRNHHGL